MPNEKHEQLIDICRFNAVALLREVFPDMYVIVSQRAIMAITGQADRKKALYPDMILVNGEQHCFIEVGDYECDKYSDDISVMHVSLAGNVSMVNPHYSTFEVMAADTIRESLSIWRNGYYNVT